MFSTIQPLSMSASCESAAEFSAVGPSTFAHPRYLPAIGRQNPEALNFEGPCARPTTTKNPKATNQTERDSQGSPTGSFMPERPVMFDLADPLRM